MNDKRVISYLSDLALSDIEILGITDIPGSKGPNLAWYAFNSLAFLLDDYPFRDTEKSETTLKEMRDWLTRELDVLEVPPYVVQ